MNVIREMRRVAKKSVFLGDLRTEQHGVRLDKYVIGGTFRHTLFQRSEFVHSELLSHFVVSDGWWGGEARLSALCRKPDVLLMPRCSATMISA